MPTVAEKLQELLPFSLHGVHHALFAPAAEILAVVVKQDTKQAEQKD